MGNGECTTFIKRHYTLFITTQTTMFTKPLRINRMTVNMLSASLLALTFTACKKNESSVTIPAPQTIAQLVTSNNQLTLLTAAVNRAGLAATLSGTGPFTVFAPTDDAFRAAGFADAAAINAAPAATLANILQYHVVSGSLPASAIPAGQTAQPTALTANGTVYVSKAASTSGTTGVSVNGARVAMADVQASNGIIHVIDQVLLPPTGTILAIAQADTTLSLLTAAVLRGGALVTGALSGTTTALTVFAPTNAAFRAAGFLTVAAINAAPETTLTAVLTNHVVAPTRAFSPTLANGPIATFGGGSVTATVGTGGRVTLLSRGNGTNVSNVLANSATARNRDITATNGVIHKIDRVLLP